MMALNIGAGDGVLVPTYSFFATAGVVSRLGATPIFVDVDPVTYNIDPVAMKAAYEKYRNSGIAIKAVCPVHLYGQSADMNPILEFAKEHNLYVVEDCAQAIGAKYTDGKAAGSIGTVGCFSFFPSKNLGGYGDGGIITVNDDELAHRIEIMRVHGGEHEVLPQSARRKFPYRCHSGRRAEREAPTPEGVVGRPSHECRPLQCLFMAKGLATETGKTAFRCRQCRASPESGVRTGCGRCQGRRAHLLPYL
jgi:dTDP-4-amino-4,6-dideoxygalactose transaminase